MKQSCVTPTWVLWLSIVAWISLHSCSPDWHINRAVKKGAVIQPDTIPEYIYQTDTIRDTITGEIIRIERTVLDTIHTVKYDVMYVPMSRQERKAYRDSLKYAHKNHKADLNAYKDSLRFERDKHKQTEKTERTDSRKTSRSWFWFILGFFSGAAVVLFFFYYANKTKHTRNG